MGRTSLRGDLRSGRRNLRFLATTSLVSASARRSSLTAWQNTAASPRFRRGATRGWVLRVGLGSFPPLFCPQDRRQVGLGGGAGGPSRHDHLGATSDHLSRARLLILSPFTACACMVSFAMLRRSLTVGAFASAISWHCLCAGSQRRVGGLLEHVAGTLARVRAPDCGFRHKLACC